ncbi:MAG: carboxysome shell carbonic anhydrase [Gammaproteobacteria bacterium]|nr:carboxysome shell carbonic anhydrase [Gammaproteobacteria bacterium]
MLRSTRHQQLQAQARGRGVPTGAALRRPGARGPLQQATAGLAGDENGRLYAYEQQVKGAFDNLVPVLKQVSALQHEADFELRAQRLARERLGFELPEQILADAWVDQLDMRRLFAWCVFSSYRRFCDDYYGNGPLASQQAAGFDEFLQGCGFHTLDISPCADGRLAHLVRYVLRLPQQAVRRKSYAGALFDIEDSIQKWTEVELRRFREGQPNSADAPTRYLKLLSYHFSSVDPQHQGCAAHGSDTQKAAQAGLDRLLAFREAIENSFCCGASIDLLLIGLDTDTDAIRVHLPDGQGELDLQRWLDVAELEQRGGSSAEAIRAIAPDLAEGMARLIERLIDNNRQQIAYVRQYHGGRYADIGHAERFIGAGVGFEEIQLRNLMYFAYMNTVEEAAPDLDVGIRIFTGLNVAHGLPVPVVLRFDHHSRVPGSRQRAAEHAARVAQALQARYAELHQRGLLHLLQVTRDCDSPGSIEVLDCSVQAQPQAGGH